MTLCPDDEKVSTDPYIFENLQKWMSHSLENSALPTSVQQIDYFLQSFQNLFQPLVPCNVK